MTQTPTRTSTSTPTPTNTITQTPTKTATSTPTNTPSNTFTQTPTKTPTNTATNTLTPTQTPTQTKTQTPTQTPTNTLTQTQTPSFTPTPTLTRVPTFSFTLSNRCCTTGNCSTPANSCPLPGVRETNVITGSLYSCSGVSDLTIKSLDYNSTRPNALQFNTSCIFTGSPAVLSIYKDGNATIQGRIEYFSGRDNTYFAWRFPNENVFYYARFNESKGSYSFPSEADWSITP